MTALSPAELSRYSRQMRLPGFGLEAQEKLRAARVLMIGAGGLGCPAALYLVAAGVGTLSIIDPDTVALHNLHRQILHGDASIDTAKTTSASARLRAINPHLQLVEHPVALTTDNAAALFAAHDVIVDGTDNFATRYLVNDAAVLARKPLVHGSVFQFEGQVTVIDPANGGPCYRCLFPAPPADGAVPNCAETGVLGALCGLIGSHMALETIKLITGIGLPLRGRLLTCEVLSNESRILSIPRDEHCPLCGAHPTLTSLDSARYAASCATPTATLSMNTDYPLEISVADTKKLLTETPDAVQLIDVREPHEVALCRIQGSVTIPMRQIPENIGSLPRDKHLLIQCHHGGRSMRVTEYLRAQGFDKVTNVAGGIDAWSLEIDPTITRY